MSTTKINVARALSKPGRVVWPGKGIEVSIDEARELKAKHPDHVELTEPLPEPAEAALETTNFQHRQTEHAGDDREAAASSEEQLRGEGADVSVGGPVVGRRPRTAR